MSKRFLAPLGLLTLLLVIAAPSLAAGSPVVRILPSDRATFLAGQKFDLRVEAQMASAQPSIQVTVNDKDAETVFGRPAAVVKDADGKYSKTWRGVSLTKAGSLKVTATATVDGASGKTTVSWEVKDVDVYGPRAKNVILIVGDGMSLPTRTAARILSKGFQGGKSKGLLAMDDMDEFGYVMTNSLDTLATDSANSASAYATGHKSSVNAMGVYPDNTPDPSDDPRVETILELVKRTRNMSTGLVTTSDITDATPAAMFAHTRRRSEALNIIDQMLTPGQRPDVIMGGGSQWFLPKSAIGSKRKDDRDVIGEFEKLGYKFAGSASELAAINAANTDKLLGLYHLTNMNVYLDREVLKTDVLESFTDQPNLPSMTKKAIDILSKNSNGFFLMVEGASVDKQLHTLDWERAVYDAIELDKAVAVAKDFARKNNDTLIIVTADHSHGMSITGTYHEMDGKRGREAVRTYENAIYPTFADADGDGFPDNPAPEVTLAIQYANHPDFTDDYRFNMVPLSPAVMKDGKAVANPVHDPQGELQTGNTPTSDPSEVHSVEDVPITSFGPGAVYLKGVIDNTQVFFGMANALKLNAAE